MAGLGAAGMALVGCGDDDDDNGGDATTAPTQAGAQPTSAGQPKVGGTWRQPIFGISSGDPPTLYPYENISYQVQTISGYHYSRLLRGASGPDIESSDFTSIEGDLAQNLPEQPDDVTYIFKFKPNIFFHDKAPMNGREATAKDFLATWDFFKGSAINAARFNNVITALESPDDNTIKITLKEPTAPFLVNGAASDQGIWFIPVETINNDQVKTDPVGTGPWSFDRYETGVRMTWKRHPKYHDSPEPYFEAVDATLVRDPQRIMAALQSGELDYSSLIPSQISEIESKLPKDGTTNFTKSGSVNSFVFNYDNKPWDDARVRQALSMALDRDGFLKLLDPTPNEEWNSFFGPALTPYYLNPRDKAKFGDSAKYFEKNIAEAKKLLTAAGYPDGLDVNIISNVDRYGPSSQQQWELVASTIREAGFNAQNVYQEYGAYIQSTYFGKITDPKGVMLGPIVGTVLDPDDIFLTCYWSGSARHNWQASTPPKEMAELDAMFLKQRTLLDLEERTEYIHDIQKKMAESMLWVPTVNPGGLSYIQPWAKNAYLKSTYATNVETFRKAYFTDERLAKG